MESSHNRFFVLFSLYLLLSTLDLLKPKLSKTIKESYTTINEEINKSNDENKNEIKYIIDNEKTNLLKEIQNENSISKEIDKSKEIDINTLKLFYRFLSHTGISLRSVVTASHKQQYHCIVY